MHSVKQYIVGMYTYLIRIYTYIFIYAQLLFLQSLRYQSGLKMEKWFNKKSKFFGNFFFIPCGPLHSNNSKNIDFSLSGFRLGCTFFGFYFTQPTIYFCEGFFSINLGNLMYRGKRYVLCIKKILCMGSVAWKFSKSRGKMNWIYFVSNRNFILACKSSTKEGTDN